MKFGLHYLMSCADSQSPVQRYRDTVEQAARSEALGFESVWPVEQHFNRNFSVLPCPALMLAAIAERTRTLRLGTAIVQVPLTHPMRIAEEIATLDVLSGGRVELGVGRGSNPVHFGGYGVPLSESRDRFIEGLDFIRQAWTQERFSFQGRFFQANDIALAPRPVQKPHPLIRIAVTSPDTGVFAGRAGYPIFVAANVNPLPKLREILPIYRNARKEAGHAEAGNEVTMLMPFYVGESRAQIKQDVEPSVNQYTYFISSSIDTLLSKMPPGAEKEKVQVILDQMRRTTYEKVNEIMGIFDTPEACVERLKQIQQDFNPSRVICWFNFGGMVPHEKVLRSMELFSSKVLPQF